MAWERNWLSLWYAIDPEGNIYSYYDFMSIHNFPVVHKEFHTMIKAIPNGLVYLMRCHLSFEEIVKSEQKFLVEDKSIYDPKCCIKITRNVFQTRKWITPRGIFFGEFLNRKAWLLPYTFCIPNKVKELHLRILHNIYPTNEITYKYGNVHLDCNFWKFSLFFFFKCFLKTINNKKKVSKLWNYMMNCWM